MKEDSDRTITINDTKKPHYQWQLSWTPPLDVNVKATFTVKYYILKLSFITNYTYQKYNCNGIFSFLVFRSIRKKGVLIMDLLTWKTKMINCANIKLIYHLYRYFCLGECGNGYHYWFLALWH